MASPRLLSCLAIAGTAVALSLPAAAQTTTTTSSARTGGPMGWLPGAGSGTGYVGANIGRSRYSPDCGTRDFFNNLGFECGLRDNMYTIYAGGGLGGRGGAMGGAAGMFGGEIGYVDMGRISRGGGDTRARGLNLSLVGRAPIAGGFGVYGKVGTTYGWTRTSSAFLSGVESGKARGFGFAYGFGATYDFTQNLSAVLAWDRHNFKFAGGGRDPIRTTSIGLQYRY